jgi:general secretion pathway protein L
MTLSASARKLLTAAVGWWLAEIRRIIPAKLVRHIVRPPKRLRIDLVDGRAAIVLCRRGGERPLGEFDLNHGSDDAGAARIAAAARRLSRDGTVVTLCIPEHHALRADVSLPIEAKGNLSEALGYEMDRLTPYRASDVYFCHKIKQRSDCGKRLSITLALLPRALVDAALQGLTRVGLHPHIVSLSGQGVFCDPQSNFLSIESAARQSRFGRRLSWTLALLATATALALAVVSFQNRWTTHASLAEQVERLRREQRVMQELNKQLAQVAATHDGVLALKRDHRPVSDLLNSLARLVPDDSWLYRLRSKDGSVEISGLSANASALIGIIEASSEFRDVAFAAPVTRDPALGLERFIIKGAVEN